MAESFRRSRLDCTTPATALSSFCDVVGLTPTELGGRFDAFDLEEYYRRCDPPADAWTVVYEQLLTPEERRWQPAEISWFHATRATAATDFAASGIRPTQEIAEYLWEMLRQLDPQPPSTPDWIAFRKTVTGGTLSHWASLYALKQQPAQAGPHAFLIREELLHQGRTESVRYFHAPETIEDICLCYEEVFGRALCLHSTHARNRASSHLLTTIQPR